MAGRTIIITGASDGIGAAAARALTSAGDSVVVVGRSAEKTAAVAAELGAEYHVADFSRLADVRALAATLLESYPRIDVLANNAGGIMGERELTVDGHEKTLQVNHLAPFLLTTLLLDRLIESRATVINTASVANTLFGNLDIDDLGNEKRYSPNKAYGDGKLANILFTRELDRRYRGHGITTAAFHPGLVATSFASNTTSLLRHVYGLVLSRFLISPAKGADTLVWLATPGTSWKSGGYYTRRKLDRANKQADDAALAARLWEKSASLVALPAD
ncbi:NAD(P)-dependent dehydrogenase (short-subunit alcohol dehydrogenase family) [Conyzicola lurida]|uniref:NAD(P)-dependent dehydrogenase (Short-subunit alcohol dehydrogenase family) n=1 Tax=Conyzicola lurida TaxID=1172621 RepID=A0A841AQJ0_9MICO|nr:NAD(P)-dependent dehydrogenase (short-subunit alcohol dehydrogenase family) [Conyzicola lurida]